MRILSTLPAWLALLALPAAAIESPPDDAPPPADVTQPPAEMPPPADGQAPEVAPPAAEQQTAYLGVVCTAVPDMLASHLNLAAGEGIIVRAVMPESPAAKAGLAEHDVITRLAGDPVGSSEELTAKISARKPGDVVALDLIRKGRPQQLDVTLGARPQELAPPPLQALEGLDLDGIPKDFADRVRRMIEGNLGEMQLDFEHGMQQAAPQIEEAMRDVRERMQKAMEGLQIPQDPPAGAGEIRINRGATFRLMDDQGSIELKAVDGGKEITVRDPQDNVVWSGPWDTDQDKAAAPEDIRQRIERLNFDEQGNGLRLHWRGAQGP